MSFKEWKPERSPRFAALFSIRGGPFHLLLPPPCPPASTALGEGLHGGLFEGSCGRRRRRGVRSRLNVGTSTGIIPFHGFREVMWTRLKLCPSTKNRIPGQKTLPHCLVCCALIAFPTRLSGGNPPVYGPFREVLLQTLLDSRDSHPR